MPYNRTRATYTGPEKELWKSTLETGSEHTFGIIGNDDEGTLWIDIDGESYPSTVEEILAHWKEV